MKHSPTQYPHRSWQQRLHEIIFEADTRAGKIFDVSLLISITLSVLVVMFESVASLRTRYGDMFITLEWFFTFLFTVEYLLRLLSVRRPTSYALSFYGVVDLLAILPSYLSLFIPGTHYLLVIRVLRLLRIFRIFKLSEYLSESGILTKALWASRRKISVFLLTVITLVLIIGALMYVIEGEEHGFVDIPTSVYWAVVTLTTVGYGDLAPRTAPGKALATVVMLLGYGILAVPTGIVSFEISRASPSPVTTQACPSCSRYGHDSDATFCKYCGSHLGS